MLVRRRRLDETQALLNGLLLQFLRVVLWPGCLEVRPVLLRLPQHAGQNAGDLFITGRSHRHHRPGLLPQRLGDEEVEVRRQLELTSEPLPEAAQVDRDCAAVTLSGQPTPPERLTPR